MKSIILEQIDELHRLNPRFRECETCYREYWMGNGYRYNDKRMLYIEASNTRFKLSLDTQTLEWEIEGCGPWEETNYLSLDGGPRVRLTDFKSWDEVEAEIKAMI